jgi:hypothetical protein
LVFLYVRACLVASLKAPPKGFGARRMFGLPHMRTPKAFLAKHGPICYLAPRGHPCYTGDTAGAPDTTKSNVGTHLPATRADHVASCAFLSPSLPSRVAHPSAAIPVTATLRRHISVVSDFTVVTGPLAALSTAGGSPSCTKTWWLLSSSAVHRRCSTVCLVGAASRISMSPLPPLNSNHLFVFRHG